MQNIDLSALNTKQKFMINGDENRVLELDVSDLNIVQRYNEMIQKLNQLEEKVIALTSSKKDGEDDTMEKVNLFIEIDTEMRECIDFIFDSNVCEVCAPKGSMYDPINGKLRYEVLIDILIALYEGNLKKELKKMEKNVAKHSAKYTKK